MKKVFYAKKIIDVCFVADEEELKRNNTQQLALHWIAKQNMTKHPMKNNSLLEVIEIEDPNQIPDSWKDTLLWGVDSEFTAVEFVRRNKLSSFE